MYYAKMNIKWGTIVISINVDGQLCGLWFEGQKYFPEIDKNAIWIKVGDNSVPENDVVIKTLNSIQKQLREYENGQRRSFDLDLSPIGTSFRHKVWQELAKIEYGSTRTYDDIGKKIAFDQNKKTMSAQAVGGAVGHNPISIIVPCHRVIGGNGSLTGYAGGLEKKVALLDHERKFSM